MRAAIGVRASAILILLFEVWACAAAAEDAIKAGKWEYWIVGSKIPEPSPGTQLSPSVRWGPEGMPETSICGRLGFAGAAPRSGCDKLVIKTIYPCLPTSSEWDR